MYMCALHDLVPPTVWNASFNKWWRCALKQSIQSIQLVHYQVGTMQYLEHNLAKCATIV